MRDDAVLVDTMVVLYAIGDDSAQRNNCRRYLEELSQVPARAYASTEMFQELCFHRMRRGDRRSAVEATRRSIRLFRVLDFDRGVLELSLQLIERTAVRGRDAVHAATALAYGIGTIASTDPAFDEVPVLRRVNPLDARDAS